MNYFELFEIPPSPVVDKTRVSKKYFALQKKFHPDFNSQASGYEQEDILQQSADINKAYKIFQQPSDTLAYYLQEKGIIETDEKYELPPEFLMQMMELNDELEGADEAAFRKQVADYETGLVNDVNNLLTDGSTRELNEAELARLKAYHYKKKYLKRILERLDD